MPRTLLLVACAAIGCGSRDSDPAGAKGAGDRPTAKETRVFEVKSSADLVNLRAEYMNLWESGYDGLLEVSFAAVPYTAAGWELVPAPDGKRLGATPTIDVVLRGESAAPPVAGRIVARSLRIEGLILKLEYGMSQMSVRDSFEMKGCLVVDSRGLDKGMRLFSVLGMGDRGAQKTRPVTVRIEDSWFVRNFQGPDPAPMIFFGSVDTAPSYFESIDIARSAFLGNAFKTELEIQFARQVKISDSLFYKTWPDGVLISSTSSGEVVFQDSVIVVENIEHIARHGEESPPIALAGSSRVYAKGWGAGQKPPEALVAAAGQIHDRGQLDERAIAEAVKTPASAIPGAELKKKLDAAFRP